MNSLNYKPTEEQQSPIKVTGIEALDRLKYLKGYAIHYLTKTGKEKVWEIASRGDLQRLESEIFEHKSFNDGAIIFATNKDKTHVVLLKEFRVSAGRYLYMLPAGLSDGEEDLAKTAEREFFEETGMNFECIQVQPPRYISVGIVNEKASVAYGYYSGQLSKMNQEDNEDAEIVIIDKTMAEYILDHEEVTLRTALLLQDFYNLNRFMR